MAARGIMVIFLIGFVFLLGNVQYGVSQETTEETAPATTDNPTECAKEFIEWCDKRDFSTAGISLSVVTVMDDDNYFTLACTTTATNGTECKRNNEMWFHCYPNKTMTFKNERLTEQTRDPDVCKAKDHYFRMVEQSNANRDIFAKTMEGFSRAMDAFRRQMSSMFGSGFPFGHDYDEYDENQRNFYNIDSKEPASTESRETELETEP